MCFRNCITILAIALIGTVGYGQINDSSKALFGIGMRVHRSFIIQHSEKLTDEITASHPWMIEADVNWHLRKQKTWEYCHCYPRTGFSLMYTNFDLPEILGSAVSLYSYIEPYIRAEHRLNYSFRLGLGLSYLTRVYDAETNPDNLFFSSPISFLVMLNVSANYRITPQLTLRTAGNYNHISNSGFSEPNYGINYPSFSVGIDYSFKPVDLPSGTISSSAALTAKKQRLEIIAGLSAKPTTSGLNETRYPVYVLAVNYSRNIRRIIALNGGIEWMSDRSIYKTLRKNGTVNHTGHYDDHNRGGVLVGIDWLFGRFTFYQHLGIYLYSPVKPLSPIYQRYGLNFRFSPHIFAGINIKAHGQDADFMDLRVGYSF
jgi:Lipid A 3-O-deacylase (PagL)